MVSIHVVEERNTDTDMHSVMRRLIEDTDGAFGKRGSRKNCSYVPRATSDFFLTQHQKPMIGSKTIVSNLIINLLEREEREAVYYPGDTLVGQVQFETDATIPIQIIKLTVKGVGKFRYATRKARNVVLTTALERYEKYIDSTHILYNNEDERSKEIKKGKYSYDFNVELPFELPHSFVYPDKGGIGYYILVRVSSVYNNFNDQFITKQFYVHSKSKLPKMNPSPKVLALRSDTACCLECAQKMLAGKFEINSNFFLPGERLRLKGMMENLSEEPIESSTAEIVQTLIVMSNKWYVRNRKFHRVVAEIDLGVLEPYETMHWDTELVVPKLPPTGLAYCTIMDLAYSFRVVFTQENTYALRPTIQSMPIIIGAEL